MSEPNTTPADWIRADLVLGLGADLLPVVPADSSPASYSKVKKFGKVPSEYDLEDQDKAHGIKGWQSGTITPANIEHWSHEPRYSICVRASAVRAIDVDITDKILAAQIAANFSIPIFPAMRSRSNSSKFLVPFYLDGPLKKRIITVGDERIELLADGQQWLLCGTHPSGVRYEWGYHAHAEIGERLPIHIPTISPEMLEEIWTALTKFSTSSTNVIVRKDTSDAPQRPDEVLIQIPDETTFQQLLSALTWPALREAAADNSVWSEIGYALLSLGIIGYGVWCGFRRGGDEHENNAQSWWAAHKTQIPRSDYRHIFTLARRYGWGREPPPASAFPIIPQQTLTDSQQATSDLLPSEPDKPIIRIQGGELDQIARRCEGIADIFAQGESLVRFGKPSEAHDNFKRDPHAQPLVRATMEYLRRELTAKATFTRFDGRSNKWVVIDCPKDLAQAIVSHRHWDNLRQLVAVVRAPFIRDDGSICTTVGYDRDSCIMYVRSADFPPVPEHPTREQAIVALNTLLAPFDEFPMSTPAARSTFAAHLLTEVARTAMLTSPMFWYSATTAGTGKTLLSEMPSLIAYGMAPAARPWVDGEEMRKALLASLLAGDRAVRFDNLTNGEKFRSAALCIFLTAPRYSDRKLGKSESLTIPNRSVVIATGNNVIPSGDLARRSLVVRMDANMTARRMRERSFKIDDIHGYVLAHRAELLVAALTVMRAHQQSGVVSSVVPMQSFPEWSRLVRDALLWLGMNDPLGTQAEETDDEASDTLGALFTKLFEVTKGEIFYAMSLVGSDNELLQALVSAGCDGMDAKKIGYWLSARKGVVAGDYKLVGYPKTVRGNPWQLVPQVDAFGDLL